MSRKKKNSRGRAGRKSWSQRYIILLILGGTNVLLSGVLIGLFDRDSVEWIKYSSSLGPWLVSILTASHVALTRLKISRREFTPSNQVVLLKATDELTNVRTGRWIAGIKRGIENGRLSWEVLSEAQRRVIDRLGFKNIKPIRRRVEYRLEKEQRKARTEARRLAAKIDRRERRMRLQARKQRPE